MMNQSTKIILNLFLPGLLLCTSCSENKSSGELPAIQIATAYKSPTEIKASECFTSVQYLPLETTEDCLLDNASQIQFIDNYILITSSRQNKAFLFDKETGKFLRTIGHTGNDPEAYRSVTNWLDVPNNRIYFSGSRRRLVGYSPDGAFTGILNPLPVACEFPVVENYTYLNKTVNLAHYTAGNDSTAKLVFFQDTTILKVIETSSAVANSFPMSEIASMNVLALVNRLNLIQIVSKQNEMILLPGNFQFFWHLEDKTYFREFDNDTIMQVSMDDLSPVCRIDFGDYQYNFNQLKDKEDANLLYVIYTLDSKDHMILAFAGKLLSEDKQYYYALYNKQTGKTQVSDYNKGFQNDLTHFLPLYPHTVTDKGEFVQLVNADEILEWFDENSSEALPDAVKSLRGLKEDDNPVVVFMK